MRSFAISLMLIAGMFTNAAIARDGSGTASVMWSGASGADGDALAAAFRGSDKLYGEFNAGVRTYPAPLPAGATENQLMFSYSVTTNMAGGQVEFSLPTGWSITKALTDILAADEKNDVTNPAPIGDPYDRYGTTPLVEVYERYGIATGTVGY